MYTAQSTISTVHTTITSQLNPEPDQSSGTIRNTYVPTYRTHIPYLHTYPYLPTYILPKLTRLPPFEINSKKDQKDQEDQEDQEEEEEGI